MKNTKTLKTTIATGIIAASTLGTLHNPLKMRR